MNGEQTAFSSKQVIGRSVRTRAPRALVDAEAAPLVELERAIDKRLRVPKRAPRVAFSPLLAEAAPAAKRTRKIVVAVSIATHLLVAVVVVLMPKRVQSIVEPVLPFEIVLAAEAPKVPELRVALAVPRPAPKPAPKPKVEPPREEPPPPVVEAPKPKPEPLPEVVKAEPPKPRPEVKVGLLDESPSAPALAASRTSRSAVVVGAGFDGAAGSTGTAARPGRVVEAAFADAPVKTKGHAPAAGAVLVTAFDADAAPKKRDAETVPRPPSTETDVEILSKPKPVYTEEARALHVEGDVVLEVVFEAAGTVRVLGVASGLGHGLDEAAVVAARKIQFVPAKRDGTPVDHAARLRVVFRLA